MATATASDSANAWLELQALLVQVPVLGLELQLMLVIMLVLERELWLLLWGLTVWHGRPMYAGGVAGVH